jgi:peptide/nickel transport system permease protein
VGLLSIATVISFALGILGGALLGWSRTPGAIKTLLPLTMTFTSIPSMLLGIFLLYVFAFNTKLFPLAGSYGRGMEPELTGEFIASVIHHGFLPALAIVLVSFGGWALGMRGMMVTTEGEDYMILAQAKGLSPIRLLVSYAMRNAILPQVTALAMSMGSLVAGSTLVEFIFAYRGMGSLLYGGIIEQDYTVIQGTVFVLIVSAASAVLIIDLLYPLVDPRISYEQR